MVFRRPPPLTLRPGRAQPQLQLPSRGSMPAARPLRPVLTTGYCATSAPMPNPVRPAVMPTPSATPRICGRLVAKAEARAGCRQQDDIRTRREEPRERRKGREDPCARAPIGAHPTPGTDPCQAGSGQASFPPPTVPKPLSIHRRSSRASSATQRGPREIPGIKVRRPSAGKVASAPAAALARSAGSNTLAGQCGAQQAGMSRASISPCR